MCWSAPRCPRCWSSAAFFPIRDEAARLLSAPYQQVLAEGIAERRGPLFQRRRGRGQSVSEAPISASSDGRAPSQQRRLRATRIALLRRVPKRRADAGQAARAYLDAVRSGAVRRAISRARAGWRSFASTTAASTGLMRALFATPTTSIHGASRASTSASRSSRAAVMAAASSIRNPISTCCSCTTTSPAHTPKIVTEIILHALWDAGLTVGQAVRNVTRMRSRWPPTT